MDAYFRSVQSELLEIKRRIDSLCEDEQAMSSDVALYSAWCLEMDRLEDRQQVLEQILKNL